MSLSIGQDVSTVVGFFSPSANASSSTSGTGDDDDDDEGFRGLPSQDSRSEEVEEIQENGHRCVGLWERQTRWGRRVQIPVIPQLQVAKQDRVREICSCTFTIKQHFIRLTNMVGGCAFQVASWYFSWQLKAVRD